jgi:hypothetical protein
VASALHAGAAAGVRVRWTNLCQSVRGAGARRLCLLVRRRLRFSACGARLQALRPHSLTHLHPPESSPRRSRSAGDGALRLHSVIERLCNAAQL